MARIFGALTAVGLALAANAASAGEWTGTITQIDEVSGNIVVRNEARPELERVFAVSDTNTVGATLDELNEGDTVSIFFADSDTGSGQPIFATTIEVAEQSDAAMMGETAEWQGAVERVDQSAGTVMVDGQEFAMAETAVVGVPLDQLQEGDQVRIVYQDADGGRREVIEITRVE